MEFPQLLAHGVGPVTPLGIFTVQVKLDPSTVGVSVTAEL